MNLYDVAKRSDRSFRVLSGKVLPAQLKWPGQSQRGVTLFAGARFEIVRADEFTWSRVRKVVPGWRARSGDKGADARLQIQMRTGDGETFKLADMALSGAQEAQEILLDWPMARPASREFSLEFTASAEASVELSNGPLLDMRRHLTPLALGRGLEVGPGVRPAIKPAEGVDVRYVEERHPSEWRDLYDKDKSATPVLTEELEARYVVGSAVGLETFDAAAYDFVFSNHVFEHLPNPIRVLRNWLRILKPGGAILGVTPDPRYTFDCRQPVTTLGEALREAEQEGHDIPMAKYDRWCRWTTPEATPQSLIERSYSIHVNFFTPETFLAAANYLKSKKEISDACVQSSTNHKDFGFAFWK